jgi:hypothetical protein
MTRYTLIALVTVFVLSVSGAVPGGHSASQGAAPTLARTVVLDGLHMSFPKTRTYYNS